MNQHDHGLLAIPLPFFFQLSAADLGILERAVRPTSIDDKWRLVVRGRFVDVHRSWTGLHVARIPFHVGSDGIARSYVLWHRVWNALVAICAPVTLCCARWQLQRLTQDVMTG